MKHETKRIQSESHFHRLTTSTTLATDNRIFGDVHSTNPYNEPNTELLQSPRAPFTRVYNSVKICKSKQIFNLKSTHRIELDATNHKRNIHIIV